MIVPLLFCASATVTESFEEDPQRFRASIKLEARTAVDTRFEKKGEHVFELALGGRVEVDADLSKNVGLFVAPAFYWVAAIDKNGGDREFVYLNTPEARVSLAFGDFDLNAGALVFNWGSSDLIAPSDILNPLDYRRNFVAAIDDAKIPVLAAELVGHFGPLTVRGVVQPFFTSPRFFLSGWDTSLIQSQLTMGLDFPRIEGVLGEETVDAIGDQLLVTERPPDRIDSGTFGARATLHVDELDLSVTAVHGWEPLPQVRVDPDLIFLGSKFADAVATDSRLDLFDPDTLDAVGRLQDAIDKGEPIFNGRYRRRNLIGFDATLAVDPLVLKLDTAYAFKRTAYTQDYRPVEHPWLTVVAGAEYFDGGALTVIVEAFVLSIFNIPSNYRLSLFEPEAPAPSMTADGKRTIATAGFAGVIRSALLEGELIIDLAAISTVTRGDVIFVPAIHWRLDDAQQLSLAATFIEGKDDGYGGVYTHNDQVSLTYVWTH